MRLCLKHLGWVALPLWCWFLFIWTHELGHVIGAWYTDSGVKQVVLHPLAFSRTDVQPNHNPALVVWAGPVLGCVLAALFSLAWCAAGKKLLPVALVGTGFAMLANGCYIGLGALSPMADTEVMVDTGSPRWVLAVFGLCVGVPGYMLAKRALLNLKQENSGLFSWQVITALLALDTSLVITGAVLFAGP